jgi:outer membrane protein assembly factor BamB
MTDRAYVLGMYTLDGKFVREIADGVASIALAKDGRHFYARSTSTGLTRYDNEGNPTWTADVPAGRFPVAPAEHDDTVYICSNRGLLSAIDTSDGRVRWQYHVTPDLHVMASLATDNYHVYAVGMDGSVTQLQAK